MKKVVDKYNFLLLILISFAPFVAYFTIQELDADFRRIMQMLSFIGVLLLLVSRGKKGILVFPKYLMYYLLFIIYVYFSEFVLLERKFKVDYLFSNLLVGGFIFFFIIENIEATQKRYMLLMKISGVVLLIAFAVILYQQLVNPVFFVRPNYVKDDIELNFNKDRLYSIYTWIGHILSAGLSFVPVLFIVVEDSFKKNRKTYLLWVFIGIIFVFMTKQRWIMLNFSVIIFLFLIGKKMKVLKILKIALLLPLIVIPSFFALEGFGVDVKGILAERILESDKRSINETTASTRLLAFKAFNKFYWDNPILGIGNIKYGMASGTGKQQQDYKLKQFLGGRSSQIHVGYLSLFYMYGLIGGCFFLGFLYNLLKRLYIDAKRTRYWAPFLGMLGLAIGNLVDVNFQVFEMGFILAMFSNVYRVQNYSWNQA